MQHRVSVGQETLGWLDDHGDPPGRDPRASAPADVPVDLTHSPGMEFHRITTWKAELASEPLDAIRKRFLAQFPDVAAAKRWVLGNQASAQKRITASAADVSKPPICLPTMRDGGMETRSGEVSWST